MNPRNKATPEHRLHERDGDRLRRTITPGAMSVELVSAFAGDPDMTSADAERLRAQRASRGRFFFSDLLYAISHQHFAPRVAEKLWGEIVSHRERMRACLGRDPGIVVATLDHLSHAAGESFDLTLISERRLSEITTLAMRDGMTGLFNHSACHELLDLELRSRRRYGLGFSILLLDIDEFKSINDAGGHQRGDRVLVALAKTLVATARDADICCRLGGDEFVVILRLINDAREVRALAERIRRRVGLTTFDGHRIAVSIGVAVCTQDVTTSHMLLEMADRALYQAKGEGKNRVIMAGEPSHAPRDPSPSPSPSPARESERTNLPRRRARRTSRWANEPPPLAGWEDDGGSPAPAVRRSSE